ncbi:SNO glutamine amidotransferase [Catenulispora acidiphila DSM 44928]|jgi:5'-phosphate synthase pdxT subunit|uniref:Pyridoxal 5'-phosphate synthase subunit PdxT n=1 Tax=Catenulispora acidiphila (strain DSM 44928 / JCM 14897 / NBRC 102108 / NRRL B-24433 / ID139908) TaxID=479433 RepID=C7QJP5_CATAD|nr:pyridoxal 5'-phosphate synthase glutaminase subunit PdxT [Catenulispora acidiphila]ACU71268.1 SNO glutamine amidotransferase [Catenulispora acidiphila DSM 44928]
MAHSGITTIGVLALQGDFREHVAALNAIGARSALVRRPNDLDAVDALIVPGGESTAMWKLATTAEMFEPVRKRIADGMPAFGTCAGMIMLADRITDAAAGQETFGGLPITVRRNAFGRQTESFEEPISFDGIGELTGVFIRAPWVEDVDGGVEVLARVTSGPAIGRIVAVRQGNLLATSFHPELTADRRVHEYFVAMVTARDAA